MLKTYDKAGLVAHLSSLVRDPHTGIGGMDPEYYAKMTRKELACLAKIDHCHKINLQTDNYV